MKYLNLIIAIALGLISYQTLRFVTYQADLVQFLLANRELNTSAEMLKMFKGNKKINKEEHEEMVDRQINAMREFERVTRALSEKYPNKSKDFTVFNKITKPINGIPARNYPNNLDFEKTLKNIREWY